MEHGRGRSFARSAVGVGRVAAVRDGACEGLGGRWSRACWAEVSVPGRWISRRGPGRGSGRKCVWTCGQRFVDADVWVHRSWWAYGSLDALGGMDGWMHSDGLGWMDPSQSLDRWAGRWMAGRGGSRRGGKSRTDGWMVGPLCRLPWCCDSGPPSSQEVGWDGPQMIHFGPEYVFEALFSLLSLSLPLSLSIYLSVRVSVHFKFRIRLLICQPGPRPWARARAHSESVQLPSPSRQTQAWIYPAHPPASPCAHGGCRYSRSRRRAGAPRRSCICAAAQSHVRTLAA